jgi:Asp-tRNA(Asn)/Glu-tRNA(Gln) amidotransferase A subunit family amidase
LSDLLLLPATVLAQRIRASELSPVALIEASLARIGEINPRLNAFCAVYGDEARERARECEAAIRQGARLGPLHGLPVAIKDFTPIAGKVTTRGSRVFADWVPDTSPVIVERLVGAGAIIIGKTTTPEFAYSSFTSSPLWGITRNPWDSTRTSGGSSGGSAVAVVTGCVSLAEGTDMGGSVRIPASFCGITGLKPALGRIPMDILPTVFDSISHFGPLARTVDDAALFLSVTQGSDDRDIQSLPDLEIPLPVPRGVRGRRFALSIDLGYYRVDAEVAGKVREAAGALARAGALVEEVHLPWSRAINDAWARYWEVFLAACFGDQLAAHHHQMDPRVVKLIERGFATGAVEFKRLEEVRTEQWRGLANVFRDHDALICPTMAWPAPSVDLSDGDFDQTEGDGRYRGLDMTCPFNFVPQCPALSVPIGTTRGGLPIGLQIIGRRFDDVSVLRIGATLEALFKDEAAERPTGNPPGDPA